MTVAAIYRAISPAIWDDARFVRVSERARLVYLHLATGPHTSDRKSVV